MLSKLISRYAKQQTLVNMAHRGFRASAVANKKPSIGDAVTILQSKVSSINQVVSTASTISRGPVSTTRRVPLNMDANLLATHFLTQPILCYRTT